MRRNRKKKLIAMSLFILIAFSTVLFQQCSHRSGETATDNDLAMETEKDHTGEVVQLSPEQLKEFGIETAVAGPGKIAFHLDLTGEIVIDPNRLAHIVPRFPGIVKEVRKKIGDRVEKDEVLAVIESNESLTPYEVRSLIKGKVIDMHLTRGELISDASHAFTIADLSEVWVNLNVYQKDLSSIRVGQKAVISAGPGLGEVVGTISYISPIVNEKTRTAIARVILPNPDYRWRPGLFVTAEVAVGKTNASIVVPKTALQTLENHTVVFVKTEDGFHPRPVSIGRTNTEYAEITSGLHKGDVYVAKGGFTLKAELQKEMFGGDDGH